MTTIVTLMLLAVMVGPVWADNAVESWLEAPEFDPALVNEGELVFHGEPPAGPVQLSRCT